MEKILVFHHHGGIGGAGLSLIHIVQTLIRSDREIIVYCPDTPDEISNQLDKLDCTVIKTKKSPKIFPHYSGGIKNALSLRSIKNLLDIAIDMPKVKSTIAKVKPDTVIVNSMTLFWIGFIAKKFSIKTICFHRETYIKGIFGFRTKVIKNGLSKWFDKVVFISKYDLQESKSIISEKFVIHDRVDFSLFENYSSAQAKKMLRLNPQNAYILYLGGFSKLKGSHIIMKAMKYLKHLDVKLIFVGGVPTKGKGLLEKFKNKINVTSKTETMKIYKKYHLENSVIFLPRTSKPEVLYKAADVVVFPSTKPHQARPIYEAGITKIPIIITDFIQTKEFAIDNVNSLTFELNNPENLANQIERVLTDENNKQKIIEKNYSLTKSKHDFSTLENDLNKVLTK